MNGPGERPVKRPLIVAHKGASGYAPGNTLAAFDLAIKQNADCIELDVQLTADKHTVVHDHWSIAVDEWSYPLARTTLSDLQQKLSGQRLQPKPDGDLELLTLDKVIAHIRNAPIELVLELKNSRLLQPLDAARQLIGQLHDLDFLDRSYILSFDHLLIASVKDLQQVRKGILYVGRLADITHTLAATGANFIETRNDFIDSEFVAEMHGRGVEVCSWATNNSDEMSRLVDLQVDLLTTDFPDVARKVVDAA